MACPTPLSRPGCPLPPNSNRTDRCGSAELGRKNVRSEYYPGENPHHGAARPEDRHNALLAHASCFERTRRRPGRPGRGSSRTTAASCGRPRAAISSPTTTRPTRPRRHGCGLSSTSTRSATPNRSPAGFATTAAPRKALLRLIRRRSNEQLTDQTDLFEAPGDSDPTDTRIVDRERTHALRQAVRELPDRSQRLLRLLLSDEEHSYTEIAAALAMPVGAIGPTRMRIVRTPPAPTETEPARSVNREQPERRQPQPDDCPGPPKPHTFALIVTMSHQAAFAVRSFGERPGIGAAATPKRPSAERVRPRR